MSDGNEPCRGEDTDIQRHSSDTIAVEDAGVAAAADASKASNGDLSFVNCSAKEKDKGLRMG